jgi:hypothetical protein
MRKITLTTRDWQPIGSTTAEELRAKILTLPVVVERDPSVRPTHIFCPCGHRVEVPARGRVLQFCAGEKCKAHWQCQRCGTRLSVTAKDAAIRAGLSETPCEVPDCGAVAHWRKQEVCAGFSGNDCPERRSVPSKELERNRIARREGRPWRCKKCSLSSPEDRGEWTRRGKASVSPEERSASSRKGQAAQTTEQRSAQRKGIWAAKTPKERSERQRKVWARLTPEERSEIVRKGQSLRSTEERQESARKSFAGTTPEMRAERMRKVWATRKQKSIES